MNMPPPSTEEDLKMLADSIIDILPNIALTEQSSGEEDPDQETVVDKNPNQGEVSAPSYVSEPEKLEKEDYNALAEPECIAIDVPSVAVMTASLTPPTSNSSVSSTNSYELAGKQPKVKSVRFLLPDGAVVKPTPIKRTAVYLAPISPNGKWTDCILRTNDSKPAYYCNKAMAKNLESTIRSSPLERLRGVVEKRISSTKTKLRAKSKWSFKMKKRSTPACGEDV